MFPVWVRRLVTSMNVLRAVVFLMGVNSSVSKPVLDDEALGATAALQMPTIRECRYRLLRLPDLPLSVSGKQPS
jgi:hypothetical protein